MTWRVPIARSFDAACWSNSKLDARRRARNARIGLDAGAVFDAGLLGTSAKGILVYLEQINAAVQSLGRDISGSPPGKLSPGFMTDWGVFFAEWSVYYKANHDAWDSGIGAFFGSGEVQAEADTFKNRLDGLRGRYATEAGTQPTMGTTELPTTPGSGFNLSGVTGLLTVGAVLAGIVILGPKLFKER